MDNYQTPAPQVTTTPPSSAPQKTKSGKVPVIVLGILLLAALGALGWQYQQANQLKSDKDELSQQVSQLSSVQNQETEADDEEEVEDTQQSSSQAKATELATGQVSQADYKSDAKVDCMIAVANLTKLWVNFGSNPDSLKQTSVVTNELGMAGPENAGSFVVVIPEKDLEDGKQFYYQCAAEQDGKTIVAGLASFQAKK